MTCYARFGHSILFHLDSDSSTNFVTNFHAHGRKKCITLSVHENGSLTNRYINKLNFRYIRSNLYQRLSSFVHSKDELWQNGFPLYLSTRPGQVVINEYFPYPKKGQRQYASPLYKLEEHTNVRYMKSGFEATQNLHPNDLSVYSLDTEMCITRNGFEVTKVTVVDEYFNVVYDTYVVPKDPILDYNTKYSGITAKHLDGVTTSLQDVQAVLIALFSANTIVIGHGLENDFRALKLVHTTVIDTSIVFPDSRGLPYKRSLKSIVADYLNLDIQCSKKGHNSVEDAVSCMKLMNVISGQTCSMPLQSVPFYVASYKKTYPQFYAFVPYPLP